MTTLYLAHAVGIEGEANPVVAVMLFTNPAVFAVGTLAAVALVAFATVDAIGNTDGRVIDTWLVALLVVGLAVGG